MQRDIAKPGVEILDNFFDKNLAREISDIAKKNLFSHKTSLFSNFSWIPGVVKDSYPVLIRKIKDEQDFKELEKIVEEVVEKKTGLTNITDIYFYYWTRHSYIPWHNDSHANFAFSIYLNEVWKPDYGGYFLYTLGGREDIRAVMPKFNTAVLQYGGVKHCTTPVNWDGYIRISMQIFNAKSDIPTLKN